MANKVEYVKVTDIYIDKDRLWNTYEKDLESLKESVETVGLITPIAVQKRDNGYKLIAGEHRLTVCKQLGWEEIPAHIIERKYDDDEIEDARLEVMEADENIKRKKGDFIAEGLLLKRRAKAYNKVLASELGINLEEITPEQYKKSLKNSLDNARRNTGSSLSEEPVLEAKINNIKTFKEDVMEKTGLKEGSVDKKLRIGTVFEEKPKTLNQLANKGIAENTVRELVVGKNIEEVKEAVEIHAQTIQKLDLPKNTNINTFYQNAMKETKDIIKDKDLQKNDPVAFAKKVEEVMPQILKKQNKIIEIEEEYDNFNEFLQLTDRDLDDINIELAAHEANEIVILFGNKTIYTKSI